MRGVFGQPPRSPLFVRLSINCKRIGIFQTTLVTLMDPPDETFSSAMFGCLIRHHISVYVDVKGQLRGINIPAQNEPLAALH